MDNKKLPIPVNVVEQQDIVAGFGNKELFITSMSLVVGIIVAIVIYIASQNMIFAIGAVSFAVVITISIITRDLYDESLIDKMRFINAYRKSQKKYEYQYHNIYEGAEVKNGK